VVVHDFDAVRSIRLPDKQIRHWSLMRMLCWPLRSALNASNCFPGGMRRLASSVAAWIWSSLRLATRSMLRKRETDRL